MRSIIRYIRVVCIEPLRRPTRKNYRSVSMDLYRFSHSMSLTVCGIHLHIYISNLNETDKLLISLTNRGPILHHCIANNVAPNATNNVTNGILATNATNGTLATNATTNTLHFALYTNDTVLLKISTVVENKVVVAKFGTVDLNYTMLDSLVIGDVKYGIFNVNKTRGILNRELTRDGIKANETHALLSKNNRFSLGSRTYVKYTNLDIYKEGSGYKCKNNALSSDVSKFGIEYDYIEMRYDYSNNSRGKLLKSARIGNVEFKETHYSKVANVLNVASVSNVINVENVIIFKNASDLPDVITLADTIDDRHLIERYVTDKTANCRYRTKLENDRLETNYHNMNKPETLICKLDVQTGVKLFERKKIPFKNATQQTFRTLNNVIRLLECYNNDPKLAFQYIERRNTDGTPDTIEQRMLNKYTWFKIKYNENQIYQIESNLADESARLAALPTSITLDKPTTYKRYKF